MQYLEYLEVQYLVSLVTGWKEVQYLEYLEVLYLVSLETGWKEVQCPASRGSDKTRGEIPEGPGQ